MLYQREQGTGNREQGTGSREKRTKIITTHLELVYLSKADSLQIFFMIYSQLTFRIVYVFVREVYS